MPGIFARKDDEARAGIDHHSQTCSVDGSSSLSIGVCAYGRSTRSDPGGWKKTIWSFRPSMYVLTPPFPTTAHARRLAIFWWPVLLPLSSFVGNTRQLELLDQVLLGLGEFLE